MVHEIGYELPVRKSLVKRLQEWVTPRAVGKFGFALMIGDKEYFLGLVVSSVVMETVVRRKKSKAYQRPTELKVIDL